MARGRTDALALTPAHRDGLRTEAGDCVTGSGHLEAVAYDALHGG